MGSSIESNQINFLHGLIHLAHPEVLVLVQHLIRIDHLQEIHPEMTGFTPHAHLEEVHLEPLDLIALIKNLLHQENVLIKTASLMGEGGIHHNVNLTIATKALAEVEVPALKDMVPLVVALME